MILSRNKQDISILRMKKCLICCYAKHLGVTYSEDAKWHDHVSNIMSSASKILSIVCKIKFTLSQKAINKDYVSLLRPILEYASVVWDNCTVLEQDTLEKFSMNQHVLLRV